MTFLLPTDSKRLRETDSNTLNNLNNLTALLAHFMPLVSFQTPWASDVFREYRNSLGVCNGLIFYKIIFVLSLSWVKKMAWVAWVHKILAQIKRMAWVVWVEILAWVAWVHKIGVGPNFSIGQKKSLCQNKMEWVKIFFRSLWFPCHAILS